MFSCFLLLLSGFLIIFSGFVVCWLFLIIEVVLEDACKIVSGLIEPKMARGKLSFLRNGHRFACAFPVLYPLRNSPINSTPSFITTYFFT